LKYKYKTNNGGRIEIVEFVDIAGEKASKSSRTFKPIESIPNKILFPANAGVIASRHNMPEMQSFMTIMFEINKTIKNGNKGIKGRP
jgi:hypothetical protein